MKSRFPTLAMVVLCALLIGTSLVLWGCSGQPAADAGTSLSTPATGETTSAGSSTTGSTQSTAPTSSVNTAPQPVNGGPGTPEYDGIPWPIVQGGWRYLGDGRFVTESGREFFWRDGRFVNPDGTLKEPTTATLAPDKAQLANQVERIRMGLIAGTLVFDWDPPDGSDFSSDPRKVLDDLEASAYRPDVAVYFKDSAGLEYARGLRDEIRAMPAVEAAEYVSEREALVRLRMELADDPEVLAQLGDNPVPAYLEIWLKEYRQSAEFAEGLKKRPEVDEVKAHSIDFALWTGLLRDMTHPKH